MPRLTRIIAAVAVALTVLPLAPAAATIVATPSFEITGDPTPTEATIIRGTWAHFSGAFSRSASCMTPLTVRVVARAEDHFHSGNFAIAAFYKASEATVYVEHGKVTPATLAHEFAHHLDVTCGISQSPLAPDFLEAAGFPESSAWYSGSSWSRVPAEQFSEAVLAWLGIGPLEIDVRSEAVDLIQLVVWLGAEGYGGTPPPRPLHTML